MNAASPVPGAPGAPVAPGAAVTGPRAWSLLLLLTGLGAASAPIAHALDVRCWIYLPVHVAPLLAGLVLGARRGLLVGALVALADLLLGNRLQGLRAYVVMSELLTYGLVTGLLQRSPPTLLGTLRALGGGMLAGRLVYMGLSMALGRSFVSLLPGLFVNPWPGMLIQILGIPLLALGLSRWLAGAGPGIRIDAGDRPAGAVPARVTP